MSRDISLFPSYDQKENRTTNYCLLILRLLYEENPKHLADVMEAINPGAGDHVGVKFLQQQKKKRGVPDGLITQQSFTIAIESKRHGSFDQSQLERHVIDLCEERRPEEMKVLIALGTAEPGDKQFGQVLELCGRNTNMVFAALTFERLVQVLEEQVLPKNLRDTVREFRDYLDSEGLLESWNSCLDVVNCAGDIEEVKRLGIYRCPIAGGAYAHRRSRFFGVYSQKTVQYIALIRGLIEFPESGPPVLKWKNTEEEEKTLLNAAVDAYAKYSHPIPAAQVFLLGDLFETDFRKDSPGGMMGSKQYFDISPFNSTNEQALADDLRGREWSEVGLARI